MLNLRDYASVRGALRVLVEVMVKLGRGGDGENADPQQQHEGCGEAADQGPAPGCSRTSHASVSNIPALALQANFSGPRIRLRPGTDRAPVYYVGKGRPIRMYFSILSALAVSTTLAGAQSGFTNGLYEIVSGTYTECCGIAGENRFPLPNDLQSFVRLTLDPQGNLATMTFLDKHLQSIFSVTPCPGTNGPIYFTFDYGFIWGSSIVFHVDPGPPPYSTYWNYSVSNNSPNVLSINGVLGTAKQGCADAPTQFSFTNLVATLVPAPAMSLTEFSPRQGALLFIQGHAGWTNVIEVSSDLLSWTPISTNVMPATTCPVCPYITFRDAASTNLSHRFYRCYELP